MPVPWTCLPRPRAQTCEASCEPGTQRFALCMHHRSSRGSFFTIASGQQCAFIRYGVHCHLRSLLQGGNASRQYKSQKLTDQYCSNLLDFVHLPQDC